MAVTAATARELGAIRPADADSGASVFGLTRDALASRGRGKDRRYLGFDFYGVVPVLNRHVWFPLISDALYFTPAVAAFDTAELSVRLPRSESGKLIPFTAVRRNYQVPGATTIRRPA